MKKFVFGLIAMVLFALIASGQTFYSSISEISGIKPQGTPETMNGIECPPTTFYSHNINYLSGFASWTGSPYKVYDQLISTPIDLVGEITFYSYFLGSMPDRNFEISFYHDNDGFPGALITTYAAFIAGNNTGMFISGVYPIYSYYFAFPASVNLVAGDWISVMADGDNYWFWCSGSGGNGCILQAGIGFRCEAGDVAFCLGGFGGGGNPEVPVSNWALLIGGILIAGAIYMRYRRLF